MKALFKKRLLKLTTHLEKGKLIHEKFDFTSFNISIDEAKRKKWNEYYKLSYEEQRLNSHPVEYLETPKPYSCGTAGCALGEMPTVDKKNWNFDKQAMPHLKGTRMGPFESAIKYFGLPKGAAWHLFSPHSQQKKDFGGRILGDKAKPKQVAANIRAFIAKMESSEAK